MGRQVKLQDTGELGDSSSAYKASNQKYYSSESAYLKIKSNNEYRLKVIDKMYELLDYTPKMRLPTFFFKKLKEFEGLGYEVVLRTMEGEKKDLQWTLCNKQFGSETAKVMYLMAIINNHVMDYYKKKVFEERHKSSTVEDVESIDISKVNRVQKSKDISKFLEDED